MYYNHSKLLYPVLLVIKCLTRSCKYTCTNINVIEFRPSIHSRVSVLLQLLKGVMMEHYLPVALHNVHCLLSEVFLAYTKGSVMIEVVSHWLPTGDFWICFQVKLALNEVLCIWIICTVVSFTQKFTEHEELLELVRHLMKKKFLCKFIVPFKEVVLIWLNEGTSFSAVVDPVLSASFQGTKGVEVK